MKIHPLFDDLIGVMFTGRTEVGETCYYRTLKDWQDAGKPIAEERPDIRNGEVWKPFREGYVLELQDKVSALQKEISELKTRLNVAEGSGTWKEYLEVGKKYLLPAYQEGKNDGRRAALDEAAREVFPLDVYDKSDPVYKALAGARDRVLGLKK